MNYATEIQIILEVLKAEPNSKERNKLASKLEDAYVWAKVLDGKYKPIPNEPSQDECTCPEGGRRFDCPVHGSV